MVCYALPYSDARTAGRADACAYGYMPWIDGATLGRSDARTLSGSLSCLRLVMAGSSGNDASGGGDSRLRAVMLVSGGSLCRGRWSPIFAAYRRRGIGSSQPVGLSVIRSMARGLPGRLPSASSGLLPLLPVFLAIHKTIISSIQNHII